MIMDLSDISAIVRGMAEKFLDHHNLNQTLCSESPTAEFIARWIYEYLKPRIPMLSSVTVSETATSRATYQPESLPPSTNGVSNVPSYTTLHTNGQDTRSPDDHVCAQRS
eukprot:CAMPEP_0185849580 /NCGR_PEP_ID=MMETSP1354-20130828/4042_1 /TAXON_ID=708628 /ORGANISM="Erythrolobus madagascarensis, Strain CCMP3276" /LENGTH=109 /DNA_ID=CAMNT_0028550137 /DNA_START=16 /DNA_END=345 /DNA_ORIENTATION=-